LKDAGVIVHRNNAMGENEKVLAIIEFSGDSNSQGMLMRLHGIICTHVLVFTLEEVAE